PPLHALFPYTTLFRSYLRHPPRPSWREFSTCYAGEGMLEPYQLGRYSCYEQIGLGPHTEVLRARLHGLAGIERQFAIKRLTELADRKSTRLNSSHGSI